MSDNLNPDVNSQALPIVVGAESEAGRREENQDHMTGFTCRFGAVYVVADGMGGHRGGAEASRMVTEGLRSHLRDSPRDLALADAVQQAAQLTNRELYAKSSSGDPNYAGMGSTLSLVVIGEGASGVECVTAHVGDSRVYLERDGHLSPLTKDHTYVQRLLDSNIIDEETARTHPDASILTRAMGQAPEVTIEIGHPVPLADGDGILLCSDGLSGYVRQQVIEETVRRHPGASECAKALVELALASGSDDNVTVQFVRFGNSASAAIVSRPARPRRTTVPESDALPPPEMASYRPAKNRWLLPGTLVLLLAGIAGALYAFRHSVFTPPHSPDGPYAAEIGRARDLHHRVVALQSSISGDTRRTEAQLAKQEGTRAHSFAELKKRFTDLYNDTNGMLSEINVLIDELNTPAALQKLQGRDAAKLRRFEDGFKVESTRLDTGNGNYRRAHDDLGNLEKTPGKAASGSIEWRQESEDSRQKEKHRRGSPKIAQRAFRSTQFKVETGVDR